MQNQDKIFTDAKLLRDKLTQLHKNQKIGMIFGTFDIVHVGHVRFIEWAKGQCDLLITALGSDLLVNANKGPQRPLFGQDIRAEVVSAFANADFVLKMDNPPFANDTREAKENIAGIINIIKPNVLIVSKTDNSFEAKKDYALSHNIEFLEYKAERPTSTTNVINKLESLEI